VPSQAQTLYSILNDTYIDVQSSRSCACVPGKLELCDRSEVNDVCDDQAFQVILVVCSQHDGLYQHRHACRQKAMLWNPPSPRGSAINLLGVGEVDVVSVGRSEARNHVRERQGPSFLLQITPTTKPAQHIHQPCTSVCVCVCVCVCCLVVPFVVCQTPIHNVTT
jgi:hypothetical protein